MVLCQSAQADDQAIGNASIRFYNACMAFASRSASSVDAEKACSCGAGYFAGALNDRELEIASRLWASASAASQQEAQLIAQAAIQSLLNDGYSRQEIDAVAAMIGSHSRRSDAACRVFEETKASA